MSLGRRPSTSTASHENHFVSPQYAQQYFASSSSAPASPATERTRARTSSETSSRGDSSRPPPLKAIHYSPNGSPLSSPHQFDLKRLLSKPAPLYSRPYGHGSGSDSDGATLFEHGKEIEKRNERMRNRTDSGPKLDININSGAPLDLDLHSFGQDTSINSLPSMSSLPSRSDPHSHSAPSPPKIESPTPAAKRTRNVLRRRPSNATSPKSPGTSKSPQTPASSGKASMMSLPPTDVTMHMTAMTANTTSRSSAPRRRLDDTPSRTSDIEAYGTSHSDRNTRELQRHEQARRTRDERQQDGNESQHRNRSRSYSRDHHREPTLHDSHLTPAGAVVEAYKRLEEARLSGGSGGSSNDTGGSSGGQQKRVGVRSREGDEAPAPYYTVVGSLSECVKVVDGETSWEGYQWEPSFGRRSQSTGTDADGGSKPGLAKTLTRKVSGRWKRGGTTGVRSEDVGKGSQVELERDRTSLQERKVGRFSNVGRGEEPKNRRSLGVSIDVVVDGVVPGDQQDPSGIVVAEPEVGMETTSRPPLKSKKSEPSSGGSKIWKLVKRISSNGLKEKYYRDAVPDIPPPVPALPNNHQPVAKPARESTPPMEVARNNEQQTYPSSPSPVSGISRFIHRSSSGIPTSPSTRKSSLALVGVGLRKMSSSSSVPHSPPSSTPAGPSVHKSSPSSSNTSNPGIPANPRWCTMTPSSSPNSSDVASSRFFSRPSACSSTSSLFADGNAPPMPLPPPNVLVAQHIISPSELLSQMDSEESVEDTTSASDTTLATSTSDDWMFRHPPATELASLPVPPRRGTPRLTVRRNSQDSCNVRSPSPAIPAFSTANPINTFGPSTRRVSSVPSHISSEGFSGDATLSSDSSSSLHIVPLPRPMRSSQRLHIRPSTSQSTPTSPSTPSPRKRRELPDFQVPIIGDLEFSNRGPTGRHSNASELTMRPPLRRRSSSVISELLSPGRWKEMGSNGQKVLTEQEKADRWDDLLERSAKAGGTLHLGAVGGEDGLRSDRLSFQDIQKVLE